MNTTNRDRTVPQTDPVEEFYNPPGTGKRALIMAITAAVSMGVMQTSALAATSCADGVHTLPAGGFVANTAPTVNWSPGVFTGTTGSVFVPDISVNEDNDPTKPLTLHGHNWAFDQGSTTCKQTDLGAGGATATGWAIPPNTPTDCVVLPVIQGGQIRNFGDIPGQSSVITPTCDPSKLSQLGKPNSTNTYFNQLGCSISYSQNGLDPKTGLPFSTTANGVPRVVGQTTFPATSYLFVAGIKSGMFSIQLNNVTSPAVGGEAGKVTGTFNYYSHIPEGQKLTSAAISNDGQFALATSNKQVQAVYACLNPLGDPGDPLQPINTNFFVPPASAVSCMSIGNNNLKVDLTTAFGPDNQPYFGGQRVINTFNSNGSGSLGVPGGTSNAAWPQCIWKNNGSKSLQDAFLNNRQGGCGNAGPNQGWFSGLTIQPSTLISHGNYMYTSGVGQPVVQMKVTVDPLTKLSTYGAPTAYLSGTALVTGLGVAEDLKSLMVYTDPSGLGLAGQEVVWKTPLCEAP